MFEDLITSKTRIKLLNIFLENFSGMFHVREVVRRSNEEINAVRRELGILEKKGILNREPRANRIYYYLDKSYPFYADLLKIYAKTSGIGGEVVRKKVKLGKIKFAMLSGGFVTGKEYNPEEVDLLIVGTVILPEIALLIKNEETKRKREINYTVMTEEEFNFRKKRQDPFIYSIIQGPRVMLIGDENALLF